MGICLLSGIGILLGAKAVGFLSRLLGQYAETGMWKWEDSFLQSGIVYYGGLLGFLVMVWLLSHIGNRSWKEIANVTAVIIPLFHAFGRLGCFFGGCCYGKISSSWIAFPYSVAGETEISSRIPTALLEAGVELILFLLCFFWYRKKKQQKKLWDGQILWSYLLIYSIWRFIIEFWRGDAIRGVFGWVSFSQGISVILFLLCIARIIKEDYRNVA